MSGLPAATPRQAPAAETEKEVIVAPAKVVIRLKALGNAPLLKKKKFQVGRGERFEAVIVFLRKQLQLEPSQSLFLYVGQSFSPSPDTPMSNIYDCFRSKTENRVIIHYSTQLEAYG